MTYMCTYFVRRERCSLAFPFRFPCGTYTLLVPSKFHDRSLPARPRRIQRFAIASLQLTNGQQLTHQITKVVFPGRRGGKKIRKLICFWPSGYVIKKMRTALAFSSLPLVPITEYVVSVGPVCEIIGDAISVAGAFLESEGDVEKRPRRAPRVSSPPPTLIPLAIGLGLPLLEVGALLWRDGRWN